MTRLSSVFELLDRLHGHGYFRPEAGALKARLTEALLSGAGSELAGHQADRPWDLEVSIGRQEGEEEVTIGIKVAHQGGSHDAELPLKLLAEDELEDLSRYLSRLVEAEPPAPSSEPATGATHRPSLPDSHQEGPASARLKVSPQWLKSVVPCTDYSYDEIDGKKIIRDYYWSKELIERLFKIKSSKTTPDDLQYVAKECCEGDLEWAKDLIARLKSPNRGENPAKEQQPAKGQPKANAKAQAKAGPGERGRSRSRHRRSRDAGREARKSEHGSSPKPPANS